MAFADNRPPVARVLDQLTGVPALEAYSVPAIQTLLDAAIAWVEDLATTRFNGISTVQSHQGSPRPGWDLYDGNNSNQLTLRKRPITSVTGLEVVTPILGYTRVYQPTEIKLYRKQGVVKVFTYKLAVEQALFNTLDYQAWGTIFPPLPQCVSIQYTWGFPQFDSADGGLTTYDGGVSSIAGDVRDPEEQNWLANLQQAAVCDAAASFLAQTAGLRAGFLSSVSFDGYAKSNNPGAYGPQVQALIAKRDELMKRRRREFTMATIG